LWVVITEVPPYTWPAHFTAVSTDLVLSGVLSTLPNPTIDLVIPVNNVPSPTKALAYIYQLLQIYLV
jgi:hypothetical protein